MNDDYCCSCCTPWPTEALVPGLMYGPLCPACAMAVELQILASQPLERLGHMQRIEEIGRIIVRGAERMAKALEVVK